MTAPFSIAASVLAVAVPALDGARLLLNDIQHLRDASKTIKRLEFEARSVEIALKALQAVDEQAWVSLGPLVVDQCKTTLIACAKVCTEFMTDVQHWTRHLDDGKLRFTDRVSVGFFKQTRIKSMTEQLRNCNLSVISVVSIANL